MAKFVIGSVYLLKNKPKMYYLGDIAGVLHFKNLNTGEVYAVTPTDVSFEPPAVKPNAATATTTTTTTTTKVK